MRVTVALDTDEHVRNAHHHTIVEMLGGALLLYPVDETHVFEIGMVCIPHRLLKDSFECALLWSRELCQVVNEDRLSFFHTSLSSGFLLMICEGRTLIGSLYG